MHGYQQGSGERGKAWHLTTPDIKKIKLKKERNIQNIKSKSVASSLF
jgi:hypothetical protein